ncbi:hypothetical protein LWI29_004670 [Acer saccharum]|uniref:Pentatricopeptide repeat-containing protein n=1 Tax=Acer saccharum TaxID=4024 RepID=A0AA39RX78_ACESA|nr:hypothetical protein LWI29_004670 [Acer saccharum]
MDRYERAVVSTSPIPLKLNFENMVEKADHRRNGVIRKKCDLGQEEKLRGEGLSKEKLKDEVVIEGPLTEISSDVMCNVSVGVKAILSGPPGLFQADITELISSLEGASEERKGRKSSALRKRHNMILRSSKVCEKMKELNPELINNVAWNLEDEVVKGLEKDDWFCISVFRLVPSCKGRRVSNVFSLLQPRSPLFSTAIDSPQVTSHGVGNEKRGINFDALFQSCTKLHLVKPLHALLVVSGKIQSIFIATKLVNCYANLGDFSFSRYTFDHISNKDVYTWNSMVSAYVHSGRFHEAVDCFYQFLLTSGLLPDFYTFPPVLKACRNLFDGKKIHCLVLKLGFEWDVFVAASLLHMYCRFGQAGVARKLFNDMPIRDRGSWTALISGYCQSGNAAEALAVLHEMRLEGVNMDPVTIASILPVCAQLDDTVSGMLIHLYVIKHGLEFDLVVSNNLINMYAKSQGMH